MEHERGNWGSSIGFLLSAIGSAVGLGNVWGFPYKMGRNGGFAFLLVYLIIAALMGFSILITELAIGRRAGKSVFFSYKEINGKAGSLVGFLSLFAPYFILCFYTVIGGYCLQYMLTNLKLLITGAPSESGTVVFDRMLSSGWTSAFFTFLFVAICSLIVLRGVKGGIEGFNKFGMPALFIMLLIVIARSVTLPGAVEGLKYMFKPNLEPFSTFNGFMSVLSTAGIQVFFSLSLAMGITVTYGSYLNKDEDIVKNSIIVIISDTMVAILAGIAVLPAAFALGGGHEAALSGPKLLFITLQDVFKTLGRLGAFFGVLFFGLVLIAAITTTLGFLETLTTHLIDSVVAKNKKPKKRWVYVTCVALAVIVLAILVAADGLGTNGLWIPLQSTGRVFTGSYFDFFDFLSEGVAMPLAALFTSILIGWVYGPRKLWNDVPGKNASKYGNGLISFYAFSVKYICPIAMIAVLAGQLMDFLGKL